MPVANCWSVAIYGSWTLAWKRKSDASLEGFIKLLLDAIDWYDEAELKNELQRQ
jgi:hypothetical protein